MRLKPYTPQSEHIKLQSYMF